MSYRGRTMKTGLVILTLNAAKEFSTLLPLLDSAGDFLSTRLVVDSSSEDDTVKIAANHGFETITIPREEFNHGGTRRLAFDRLKKEVDAVIYITQDILPHDDECLKKLVAALEDESVGAAYGRQLPHEGASRAASVLRFFNYPPESSVKSYHDRKKYGLKAAFLSDSFAAYRVRAVEAVGGFPKDALCAEDMYLGAKLLMGGYRISYEASAMIYHSHEFTVTSAWRRYRDIGKFHRREKWIDEAFGRAEGEGMRLLKTQLSTAWQEGSLSLMAKFIIDDAVKFAAFRCGQWGSL